MKYRDSVPFIIGGAFLLAYGGWLSLQAFRSGSWPSVTGQIVRSSVESGDRTIARGHTSAAHATYKYSVEGQSYENNVVRIGQIYTASSARSEEIARQHPIGPATVYYAPSNPKNSALERGLHTDNLLLPVVGCVFLGTGIILIVSKKRQLVRVAEIKRRQQEATEAADREGVSED